MDFPKGLVFCPPYCKTQDKGGGFSNLNKTAIEQSVSLLNLIPVKFLLPNLLSPPHTSPRYYYAHKSSRDPWPKYTGVKHGDELEFTFGTPLNPDVSTGYRADEVGLARDIVTYWTNFVKTG